MSCMTSLDVESFLTNMPLEERLKIVLMIFFFFDKSKIDNLSKQDVYDLLSVAAK